jgi:predicted benzoate:H+ symporter BenE
MAILAEALLFLLPFALYLLWRRLHPGQEPGLRLLVGGAVAVAAGILALLWFGLSRSLDQGVYVPPHFENGRLVPGHTEPTRP